MKPQSMDAAASDGVSNQQPEPAKPRIGRYVVDRLLDRGGMAEVFLGKALGPAGFSKRVVIKRILPHLAEDESFVTMFLNEARLVALLEHPNIAQVFDFGQHSETYYIAMEYVEGESLRVILKYYKAHRQRTPLTPMLAWIQNVCEGLAYAHNLKDDKGENQGIVHRDISPENILISKAGTAKVVDFGIAKAALNPHITAAGEVRGKLSYIAPEQISGAKVDRRADVYSLGVTLYEALAGERPHTGTNQLELLYSILNSEPPAIHTLRPDVDPALSAIVSRALARDPNQRFPDMQALYSEIDDYRNSHSLRVKSSELADIVALAEKWNPRSRSGTPSGNSLGSLSPSSPDLLPQHTGKPPGSSGEGPPLPAITRPGAGPIPHGTPPGGSAETPPPLPISAAHGSGAYSQAGGHPPPLATAAASGSGAIPRVSGSGIGQSTLALEPMSRQAPKGAAMPRPRSWGRLGTILGAAVVLMGLAVLAMNWPGSNAADPAEAAPKRAAEVAHPAQQPTEAAEPPEQPVRAKISVPSISLVPETPPAPPPPVPAAPATPASRQRQPQRATSFAGAKAPARPAIVARQAPEPARPHEVKPPEPAAVEAPPAKAAVEAPSAPPPVAGDGWLNLRTEPWCEVYFRGELVGTTPINRLVFPAGKHSLRLVNKAAGVEKDVVVEVRPGEESTARLKLSAD